MHRSDRNQMNRGSLLNVLACKTQTHILVIGTEQRDRNTMTKSNRKKKKTTEEGLFPMKGGGA